MSESIVIEAAAKLTRFKQFIADRSEPSMLIHVFMTMSIGQMLDLLRPRRNETTQALLTGILMYAGLTESQFAPDDVMTCILYLDYFRWVLEKETAN